MAKTLVFIHGWASSPEVWHAQKEYFGERYEVILPDISGDKDIAEAAGRINVSIKDKESIILIGWSLGWLAVLEWFRSYGAEPRRLPQGLIAVNSTAKFCDDGYLGTGPSQTHLAKMIRDCRREPEKTAEDFYRGLLTEKAKGMLSGFNIRNVDYPSLIYGLYMLRDCDYRDFLDKINIPALIISGADDKICPMQASEYMHKRIGGSQSKVFDCGHIPFIDKAEEFNSTIDDFIGRL